MKLSNKQKKFLKARAHSLKPVVMVGAKGLSPTVYEEIDLGLNHHELIKIKLPALEKSDKNSLLDSLCKTSNATLVGLIGRIAILFRQNPQDKTKFELPR